MKIFQVNLIILLNMLVNLSFGQDNITLKPGDKAPVVPVFKWIKGDSISGWQKDMIYVVDFGATWCGPCAAAIPELNAIQQKYKSDVQVVSFFVMERHNEPDDPLNTAYVQRVIKYVEKKDDQINYKVGVDGPDKQLEKRWIKASGFIGVPEIFLIDKNGLINWMGTNPKEVGKRIEILRGGNNESVGKAVENPKPKYDPKKLLLIDNNGGDQSDFLFRSLLTRYDGTFDTSNEGFVLNYHLVKPNDPLNPYYDKYERIGFSIGELYYQAYSDTLLNIIHGRNYKNEFPDTLKQPHWNTTYGKAWFEPILEVADKNPFVFTYRSPSHRYNYSLKVPKGIGTSRVMQAALRRDLDTYFGFHVVVEMRSMPYWKLSLSDNKKALRLKSKDQSKTYSCSDFSPFTIKNAEMRDVIVLLDYNFGALSHDRGKLPHSEQAPFIDETGINYKIDFVFDRDKTFEEIIAHLKDCGLELTKSYKPMKVVVIRD